MPFFYFFLFFIQAQKQTGMIKIKRVCCNPSSIMKCQHTVELPANGWSKASGTDFDQFQV